MAALPGSQVVPFEAESPDAYENAEDWADKVAAMASYAKRAQDGPPPEAPGVYGLWLGGRCAYVGQSRNLAKRLSGHERKREFPGCVVQWAICRNHVEVERWLIEGLSPHGNRQGRAALKRRSERERRYLDVRTLWRICVE